MKVPLELLETEEDLMRNEQMIKNEKESALSHKDYMREARAKLDELLSKPVNVKSCLRDLDDLDDLNLGSDEEEEKSVGVEEKSTEKDQESANMEKVVKADTNLNDLTEGDDTENDLEGTDTEDEDHHEKDKQADNKADDSCNEKKSFD